MVRSLCLAAAAALLLAAPQAASAYWPYGCGYGYGFGYGCGPWMNPSYFNGGIYASPLPYYAEFPPVYYSHQIQARHYGASPFAWYAGQEPITYVAHAAPQMPPMPLMVQNPYVGPRPAAPPAAANGGSSEVQPVTIENPFVASTNR